MKTIKSIFLALIGLVAAFAETAHASRAEFGRLDIYPGLQAAADLTAKQYVLMRMSAAGLVNQCSEVQKGGAATAPIGVLQNKPKINEEAIVAFSGLSKVFGGGTVTAGAVVATTVSGTIVNAVSGDVGIGRAMETATTHGEIVTVMLFPPIFWGGPTA